MSVAAAAAAIEKSSSGGKTISPSKKFEYLPPGKGDGLAYLLEKASRSTAASKIQLRFRDWRKRKEFIETQAKLTPRLIVVKDLLVSQPGEVPSATGTKSGLASLRMYITGVNVLPDEGITAAKKKALQQQSNRKSVKLSRPGQIVSNKFIRC